MYDLGLILYNNFHVIASDKKFKDIIHEYGLPVSQDDLNTALTLITDLEIIELHKFADHLKFNWEYDSGNNLVGSMQIIPLKDSIESWSEKLYYDGCNEKLKSFRPLDIFVEEACCGIVLDGTDDATIYYHTFGDSEVYSLDIDFRGYLELGIEAKWFLDWQMYIVEIVSGEQPIEIPFKDGGMKEVFPDFDLDAFKAKFEELRLSKRK